MGLVNFGRIKNWLSLDNLFATNLNAEFNNLFINLQASTITGAAGSPPTVPGMQATENPGTPGSENLPVTIQDDIRQLRYQIDAIMGTPYWYSLPPITLSEIDQRLVDARPVDSSVVTGAADADGQPMFLLPDGSDPEVHFNGAPTPLQTYFDGEQYLFDSDLSLSGLSLAPASNNTCLVANIATNPAYGFPWTGIPIDTVGSEITALNGKIAAFAINTGGNDELFIALVDTTAGVLRNARRAYFFNSAGAHIPAIDYTTGDTITLLKIAYIFAVTDLTNDTLQVTYNQPFVSDFEPISPAIGDFWFDLWLSKWKSYSGSAWVEVYAVLLGITAQNAADCIAARSVDFANVFSELNTVNPVRISNTVLAETGLGSQLSVYGEKLSFGQGQLLWTMPNNLESGQTEQSNTRYFLYLTPNGDPILSSSFPLDRRADLRGFYHPAKPWRFVGSILNDGSSHFSVLNGPGSYWFGGTESYSVGVASGGASGALTAIAGSKVELLCNGPSATYELASVDATSVVGFLSTDAEFILYRNGAPLWKIALEEPTGTHNISPACIRFVDSNPAPGFNVYELYADGTSDVYVTNCFAIARCQNVFPQAR